MSSESLPKKPSTHVDAFLDKHNEILQFLIAHRLAVAPPTMLDENIGIDFINLCRLEFQDDVLNNGNPVPDALKGHGHSACLFLLFADLSRATSDNKVDIKFAKMRFPPGEYGPAKIILSASEAMQAMAKCGALTDHCVVMAIGLAGRGFVVNSIESEKESYAFLTTTKPGVEKPKDYPAGLVTDPKLVICGIVNFAGFSEKVKNCYVRLVNDKTSDVTDADWETVTDPKDPYLHTANMFAYSCAYIYSSMVLEGELHAVKSSMSSVLQSALEAIERESQPPEFKVDTLPDFDSIVKGFEQAVPPPKNPPKPNKAITAGIRLKVVE